MSKFRQSNIYLSFKRIALALMLLLTLLNIHQIRNTRSMFTDQESSDDNLFAAGAWGEQIEYQDFVINEVMWMGSDDLDDPKDDGPDDQWIELKNVSDKEIQIKDWYLEFWDEGLGDYDLVAVISNNRIIKPGEFYLLTHQGKSKSAINVNPDQKDMNNFEIKEFEIRLYTTNGFLVDVAGEKDGDEPGEGSADDFFSMERKDPPGDGDDYDNWYSCIDDDPLIPDYWDSGRSECGTPGAENSEF